MLIYSKPNCAFCDRAKAYLNNKGIPFEVIDVTTDPEALAFIKGQSHTSVPQLYHKHKGKLFVSGGYEGLSKLSKEDIERLISEG